MKVINVKRSVPKVARRFENLLWADVPQFWNFHGLYHKGKLYITITINSGDDQQRINREYLVSDIKKREGDLWGLAWDCAQEIIHSFEQV